jgi:hypothetical protein
MVYATTTTTTNVANDQCFIIASKVVNGLAVKKLNAVTINYSKNNQAKAMACKNDILAQNKNLTVNLHEVKGKNKFRFSKS